MPEAAARRKVFAALHEAATFVMPNVWDVGSARLFESLGFSAVATTSSGFAATLGRHDQTVTLEELVTHVAAVCAAVAIPVSVDSEDGYGDEADDLVVAVDALADAGAAGVSIEDYRPKLGLMSMTAATERVGVFADAAKGHGMTVTARAENHLYDAGDLDDTIERLQSYASAGADVVYAPGLIRGDDLARVVAATERPVNALLLPVGPDVTGMRDIGVRRLSTGGALTFVAYGAAARAGRELLERGTLDFTTGALPASDRERVFG